MAMVQTLAGAVTAPVPAGAEATPNSAVACMTPPVLGRGLRGSHRSAYERTVISSDNHSGRQGPDLTEAVRRRDPVASWDRDWRATKPVGTAPSGKGATRRTVGMLSEIVGPSYGMLVGDVGLFGR
jgi:hypothetical protein